MTWSTLNAILTFLDYTNVTVISLTAIVLLYSKSAGVLYFCTGAVACSQSVKVIKKFVRQPRPPNLPGRRLKKSYGMPSTHSAAISYFATYIMLSSTLLPMHPSFGAMPRWLPPLITLPWAVTIMMSRVWLGHHTWPQVFAGVSFGTVFAIISFAGWVNGLNSRGKVIEEWFHSIFL
ncbi:phosphatidic acid phosphatase type 2/haloperoxidase [Panaeolus papilionaceus]|nr:phosphatidic acid phosphatase type 2/haloperoxidase [Panaeolus papilionaceus]